MRNAIGLRPALVTLIWAVALLSVSSAQAETPAPGFEVAGFTVPSTLSPEPGSDGIIRMFVYNGGSVPSGEGATLTDTLPAGLEAVAEIPDGENVYTNRNNESPGCSGSPVVACPLPPMNYGGDPGAVIDIPVRVLPGASSQSDPVNRVSMSGGGVPEGTSTSFPIRYDAEPPGPGFAAFAGWVTNADGTADTQAGSHPYEITTAFAINQSVRRGYDEPEGGEPLALDLAVPPGLVGEPGAVPQCTRAQFDSEGGKECPADSQIGVDLGSVIVGASEGATGPFAVYNLVPPPGVAAQFAFDINHIQVFLTARVRSGGDYGITEHANIPQNGVLFNSTTLWGVPGEASHNPEREGAHCAPAANGCGFAATVKPLLTMPTSCQEAGQFSLEMLGTWQTEATAPVLSFPSHNNEGTPVGMTGCERLSHFNPSISLGPETSFADTPTGLTATVKVPQGLNPEGLATPGLKETTVTLPEGVVINPGQATGLAACQLAEENIGGPEAEKESEDGPPSCPLASKVGTDEISTPLLAHRLKGNVYILQSNPPNLQLLVAAEGEGVFLKLIGTVHLNEQTGQLTTTFKGTPQDPGTPDAPLNEFVLSFSGGAQAALVTPETCGVYTATADFTPWSTPLVEDALSQSNFTIDSGPGGSGSCTAPLPFAPTMTAGATTDQAGGPRPRHHQHRVRVAPGHRRAHRRPRGGGRRRLPQRVRLRRLAGRGGRRGLRPRPEHPAGTGVVPRPLAASPLAAAPPSKHQPTCHAAASSRRAPYCSRTPGAAAAAKVTDGRPARTGARPLRTAPRRPAGRRRALRTRPPRAHHGQAEHRGRDRLHRLRLGRPAGEHDPSGTDAARPQAVDGVRERAQDRLDRGPRQVLRRGVRRGEPAQHPVRRRAGSVSARRPGRGAAPGRPPRATPSAPGRTAPPRPPRASAR